MGGARSLVPCIVGLAACLPRPQPAQPQAQVGAQAHAQGHVGPGPAGAQGGVTVAGNAQAGAQPAPGQPPHAGQPYPPQPGAYPQQPGQPVQQPGPPQAYPPPQPGAYPQQPYPQQGQPGAYPQQGQPGAYPQQPPPAQPYPPPYPQQPQPGQPYPPPQAYPPPAAYPAPSVTATGSRRRFHDGEVIADFAVVGTFGAINLIARQEIDNGNAVSFILLGGIAGGGGVGYLLTQKYPIDAGAAHSTTLGLLLGFANGALLIEPTGWTRDESIINLLFLGSAIGATGGFVYGQAAKLTSGQALFIANMTLLGTATAAFGAISGSRDSEFGNWESGALAVGIDGGTIAGAVVAPSLDWSPRRSKVVLASTVIGAFAGGMMAGLLATPEMGQSRTESGDVVAAAMTAGMWGGFALGIMMTKQYAPDPKFARPTTTATAGATSGAPAAPTAVMPWVGHQGQLGVMAGGSF